MAIWHFTHIPTTVRQKWKAANETKPSRRVFGPSACPSLFLPSLCKRIAVIATRLIIIPSRTNWRASIRIVLPGCLELRDPTIVMAFSRNNISGNSGAAVQFHRSDSEEEERKRHERGRLLEKDLPEARPFNQDSSEGKNYGPKEEVSVFKNCDFRTHCSWSRFRVEYVCVDKFLHLIF